MSNVEQLKKNVAATLESTGVLARIRAELRAEVFAAIEMQKPIGSNIPQTMDEFARSEFGKQSIDLVIEFLHFFGLKHTLSVFTAETHRPDSDINRDSLWNSVSPTAREFSLRKPLLVSLLEHNKPTPAINVAQSKPDPFSEGQTSVSRPHDYQQLVPKQHDQQAGFSLSTLQTENAAIHYPTPQKQLLPQVSTFVDNSLVQPGNALPLDKDLDPQSQSHEPIRDHSDAFTNVVESTHRNKILGNTVSEFESDLGKTMNLADIASTRGNTTLSLTVPTVQEVKGPLPMDEQLQQIDKLLKQLDTKQKLTDIEKAHLKSDSHHLVEDFSDNDDIEFDDEDFDYEPSDAGHHEPDEIRSEKQLSEIGVKPSPSPPRPLDDIVECFSDDPSADEDTLDAFDVVHEVRLISQRTI